MSIVPARTTQHSNHSARVFSAVAVVAGAVSAAVSSPSSADSSTVAVTLILFVALVVFAPTPGDHPGLPGPYFSLFSLFSPVSKLLSPGALEAGAIDVVVRGDEKIRV
jgi:hypothetical protein